MITTEIERGEFCRLSAAVSDSVFISSAWTVLFDDLRFYKIESDDKKLIALFYVRYFKKMMFSAWRTPLFTPHAWLWIENKSKNKANYISTEKKVIAAISSFFKSKKGIKSVAFSPAFTDFQPFIWDHFKVVPNYTYIIPLEQSLESIQAAMSPERRNDIKKAEKDNIMIKREEDMNVVLSMVNSSLDRNASNSYNDLVKKILFDFAKPENSFAFAAYRDDKAVAASFCIFDKNKTYYLLGGYDSQNRHGGAGASCIWHSIKLSKEMGISEFDFEGSMIKPVESYFRGFGGNLTPYHTVNKAPFLAEIVLKYFYRSTF
jgi:lipid II:glycine glycyltransferase (peptidoglycan interpeptide bridge formation enzyme)